MYCTIAARTEQSFREHFNWFYTGLQQACEKYLGIIAGHFWYKDPWSNRGPSDASATVKMGEWLSLGSSTWDRFPLVRPYLSHGFILWLGNPAKRLNWFLGPIRQGSARSYFCSTAYFSRHSRRGGADPFLQISPTRVQNRGCLFFELCTWWRTALSGGQVWDVPSNEQQVSVK